MRDSRQIPSEFALFEVTWDKYFGQECLIDHFIETAAKSEHFSRWIQCLAASKELAFEETQTDVLPLLKVIKLAA